MSGEFAGGGSWNILNLKYRDTENVEIDLWVELIHPKGLSR